MYINKNKGISLLVLIITIIVIIILAGAVILSLSQNNPISSANKSVFLNDVKSFKTELDLYKTNEYVKTLGAYESNKLFADENSITYDIQIVSENIGTLIPSLGKTNKYQNEFEVIAGELWYKGADERKQNWAKNDAGIEINDGKPKVAVSTIQTLPIKAGADIKYTVKFSSNIGITNINLDGKIKITDESGNDISAQPVVEIGVPSGTSNDKSRIVDIVVNTKGISEGKYKVKVLPNAVENASGSMNEEESLSSVAFEIDNTAPSMPKFTTVPADLSNWINTDVIVTITKSDSRNKLQYSLDEINYQDYTTPITVTNNLTVYAKEIDQAINESDVALLKIIKIDKTTPQQATINVTTSGINISGTITLADNESGINLANSKYVITPQAIEYGVNDAIWNTATIITSNPQNISKTTDSGDYYVHVLSTDNAGNKRSSISNKVTVVGEGVTDPGYNASQGVNGPVLKTGMIPVKWSGTILSETTANDSTWYNYINKQWANAITKDTSGNITAYWVWIPRYEYKISNPHTSTAQTIDVRFINGTGNGAGGNYTTTYGLHPAFTFGSTQLTGIWVAKFEASGSTTAVNVLPGVSALRSITIGSMFDACRNMETNSRYGWGTNGNGIDTHLMKNVEWGAVAYLSSSTYGKTGEIEINSNSSFITGGGTYTNNVGQSTTGNVYGVYDINGGSWEYVAGYVENGNSSLTTYGGKLTAAGTDAKYRDVYTSSGDTQVGNYSANSGRKGDAVYETSSNINGSFSWYGDYLYMPYSSSPFFIRGGGYDHGSGAGAFSIYYDSGNASAGYSFFPVLAVSVVI